jgi:hypothetical protein
MANETPDSGPITLIDEFSGRQPGFRLLRLHRAQRSVQEFAVAAHPAAYRVVIETTAD